MASEVKRGRGRPVVFAGKVKTHVLSVIRKHGLTKGREVLEQEGTSISLPTMGKLAAAAGIELQRGRPAGVANKPKAEKPKKAAKAEKKGKKAKKKDKPVAEQTEVEPVEPAVEPVVEPVAEQETQPEAVDGEVVTQND